MREAGEDHLVEPVRLGLDRRDDARMAVAMRDDPPRRDRIEDAAAVRSFQPCALGRAQSRPDRGCSACCVNGCQTGEASRAVMSQRPPESRRAGSGDRKPRAGSRRRADRGAAAGRADARRPSQKIVRSESACSSPTKAMPSSGMPRRFRASIERRLWLMVPRRVRGAQDDGHAPAGEEIDLQEVPG